MRDSKGWLPSFGNGFAVDLIYRPDASLGSRTRHERLLDKSVAPRATCQGGVVGGGVEVEDDC